MIIKCGLTSPETETESRVVKHIGDLVEERTDGRLKFQYFYSSSLIKKPQIVEGVARGIADISIGPISFVVGKVPAFGIFEVYGAFDLNKWAEMEDAIDPLISRIMKENGIHHLGLMYAGATLFPHKSKFLKTPADWKGQKMRLGGKWQSTLGKMWGASPVFMPPGDLYLALQRGVIDGYMLPWHLVYGFKLYEVAPYITHCGFSQNTGIITMGQKKYESLTPEDQAIIDQVAKETRPWSHNLVMEDHVKFRKDVIAKGGKVYDLTPEEKSLYLKSAYSIWPEVRKASGPDGAKFMDILENYRAK